MARRAAANSRRKGTHHPVIREADELAGVERVAFVEEVSSLMRHAMRNKLAIVSNAATYMRRRLGETEAWRSDAKIGVFYGMLQSELGDADDLLEPHQVLTHLFSRNVERVDAAACVRLAVESARLPDEFAQRLRVDATPGDVTADRLELALAIRHLLHNAVEALAEPKPIEISGHAVGGRYEIAVSDEGPGVAEGRYDAICEPFFTTKRGHVGVGLCVARRVARRFGGELGVGPSSSSGLRAVLGIPSIAEGSP